MEANNKMYWKDLIEKLKNNENLKNVEVDYNNEQIDFKEVALLNRFGFRVPESLVYYNDNEIDFSDDPDITQEDLETGAISWSVKANFMLEPEVAEEQILELANDINQSWWQANKSNFIE